MSGVAGRWRGKGNQEAAEVSSQSRETNRQSVVMTVYLLMSETSTVKVAKFSSE